jgi:hypothetical protein
MSLNLVAEVWTLLRENIPADDRDDAAHGLVEFLMDQGYDLTDMAFEFSHDSHLKPAVKFYADDADDEDAEAYKDDWVGDDEEDPDPDW